MLYIRRTYLVFCSPGTNYICCFLGLSQVSCPFQSGPLQVSDCEHMINLIRRRLLHMVDHDYVNRVLVVFQFQSQLLLKCGEKRG